MPGERKAAFSGWLIARTGRPEMRNMSQFFERGMTKRVKFQHGPPSHSYFCFMSLWLLTLSQSLLRWLSSRSTVASATEFTSDKVGE
jgi:hypothetical protein